MKFDRVIKRSAGLKVRPEQLFQLIPKQSLSEAIVLEKAVKKLTNTAKD